MAVCDFMPDELFKAPKKRIVMPNVCLRHGLMKMQRQNEGVRLDKSEETKLD